MAYGGLSSQTSNPYRPYLGETPQWTTTVVDALKRVKSVTTPDSAAITTSYTGNETTVTDQAGKKRKTVSDSLGRIVSVLEDPLGVNYQTNYGYNALGNLTGVYQDYLSQPPRAFVYDSLGRLVSAANPENGTTTFQYDAAGNLLVKTDARGVATHYSYDALNRPIRRWYNGSSATTATTNNNPSLPLGVGSSNEINYFYDQQTLPGGAPTFTRGPSNGALVAMTFAGTSEGNYFGRDAIGRQLLKIQRTGSVNYQMTLGYSNVGAVTSLSYPSGRTVSYVYDGAGRLSTLSGTLGDGTSRTYSNNIAYSPFGGLAREDFGTNTPLYRKSFYNNRGQLFDTRLSSVNDTWDWNRGRLILYYSSNHTWGQSGTDNNGNVRFAETWIPPANATLDQVDTLIEDAYTYDALNRLCSVAEQRTSVAGGWGIWQQQFRQQYTYDRWGNRTIDAAQTWGTGVNNKQFTVTPYYNRLGVPGGQTGVMTYDAAGNLTNDTYTGAGNRTYDAENRITSAWGGSNQAQLYVFDPAGERIKRSVNGVETWQVYGFGGELLSEYPVSGTASSPQKEYAYRNGELLITAEPGTSVTIQWVVSDHLGTPRMVVDQAGTLASVKRHDYLPFGENLPAGVGGRTSALGYNADTTRQRFTGYESDVETDLNFAQARYQSSVQGRFTSTDPVSGTITDPQTWNMYSYVGNNPINRTDPTGMSYFVGSGANDPWIRENQYRVDGFDMSPPGTASSLTDESMLSFAPNWSPLNPATQVADPQTPTSVTAEVPPSDTLVNIPFKGTYITGVGSIMTFTIADQYGRAIPNAIVIEKVSPPSIIQNPDPVILPNGTVNDFAGRGVNPTQPLTFRQAGDVIVSILAKPTPPVVQDHRFTILSPTSGVYAVATHRRSYTNLDAQGNLRSFVNPRTGRSMNNFSITVSPITVIKVPMVMCPRF